MSEFVFQQALVRLLTDARMRQAVFAGDLLPLTEAGLTTKEAQRFLGINRERLELFADLLIKQHINDLVSLLPLTAQLLGDRLQQIALEFNREVRAEYSRRREYALAFAGFLSKQFSLQEPDPPFLRDILSYEQFSLELYDRRNEMEPPQNALPLQHLHDRQAQSWIRPRRLPNTHLLSLNYDVLSLTKELKDGRIPSTPVKQPTFLLLRANTNGIIEHDGINLPTLVFIEACDGQTSLCQIIERLALDFQQMDPHLFTEFERGCLGLCESLVTREIIRLDASVTAAEA